MKQVSLFDDRGIYNPLASRLRPDDLDGFVGQEHLLGKEKLLHQLIGQGKIPSMILWGLPGMGKTILTGIIAKRTNAQFINFSAVTNGIEGVREVVTQAKNSRRMGVKALLFVDKIHRLNRAQQGAFLPYIEEGSIILIGTTTENPSFKTNSALLSRYRAFVPQVLTEDGLARLIKNVLKGSRELDYLNVEITDHMIEMIAGFADGDARAVLNTLEAAVTNGVISPDKTTITEDALKQYIGKKSLLYDKKGEEHYNLISTLHKSAHSSDPGTTVYWLARMLGAGKDPLYIARRLVRFANEGMGMANSQALTLAMPAYQACHLLGMPGCNVHLSHAVIYLPMAPKSNSAYMTYESVKVDAQNTLAELVPFIVRNAPTRLMKDLHYDDDYVYAHDTKEKVARMQCLPDSLEGGEYYRPTDQGAEEPIKGGLEEIRKWKRGK